MALITTVDIVGKKLFVSCATNYSYAVFFPVVALHLFVMHVRPTDNIVAFVVSQILLNIMCRKLLIIQYVLCSLAASH